MNSGIAISFIIGGLLLISIISMNSRVMENSGEAVLNMTAKKTVETVSQVINRDMQRIGYNTGSPPSDAIKEVTRNTATNTYKLKFEADIDDNNTEDPVTITWEANPVNKVTATSDNTNDYKLTRTVDGGPEDGTIAFSVTDFDLTFYDINSNPTTTTTNIRIIDVSLEAQAPVKYGNKSDYEKSIWNKTFTPPNLNFGAYNL
jgi:hypothetical protein